MGDQPIPDTCMVAWCFNQAFRERRVHGDYVCTAYDDDLLYPRFLERMAGALDAGNEAVWCSQRRTRFNGDQTLEEGFIIADRSRTGAGFCGTVDGGQVMFRRSALERISQPYLDERLFECHISDGMFLERLGQAGVVFAPIPEVLCENRRTPWSRFRTWNGEPIV